jgi:hypothetical protein
LIDGCLYEWAGLENRQGIRVVLFNSKQFKKNAKMATQIKIDGSRLIHKNFVLIGTRVNPLQPATVTRNGTVFANPWQNNFLPIGTDLSNGADWYINGGVDSPPPLETLFDLPDDAYTIIVQSANFSLVTFTVTNGIVDYDHSIDSIVSGRGTNNLVLIGVNITIDASYIIGRGVNLGSVWDDFRAKVIGNFLPNLTTHTYSFIVGSGLVADINFRIDISGKIIFDDIYKGYASGSRSNCLTLFGYPILIDARKTTSPSFEVIGPWDDTMVDNHNPKSASKVVMGNFMPLRGNITELLYGLKQDALGHQTGFFLNNKGVITLSPGFTKDRFNGMSRIIVS